MDVGRQHERWLKTPRTRLIGRERDIGAVTALLDRDDVGLVTLTGAGGVGKTQLALHVANRARGTIAEEVVLVDLSVVTDPSAVLPAIGRQAGIHNATGKALLDQVARTLRRSDMLMMLDNFEHVLEASGVVVELLATCLRLTVLATSREPLHLRDEHVYPVSPLATPDRSMRLSLVETASHDAVDLFLERGRAVQPDFEITSENVSAIADICCRLDGIPLAIELAATRIHVLPPDAMRARLQHLATLSSGGQDVPERQHTMAGAIAWSYDLLTEEERWFFRHMAVFTGGFTLAGAGAVTARLAGDALDCLQLVSSLVDKNLIRPDDGGNEPRYTMLETIRQCGREQLERLGELEAAQDAHAAWCLDLATSAAAQFSPVVRLETIGRLDNELANIRVALAWLAGARRFDAVGTLAVALGWYWYVARHEREGVEWLRLAGEACENQPGHDDGAVWWWATFLAQRIHTPDVDNLLDRVEALARASGDADLHARVTLMRGMQAVHTGDYWGALTMLDGARSRLGRVDDPWHLIASQFHRGTALYGLGNLDAAVSSLEAARTEGRRLGDEIVPTWSLRILALIASDRGENAQAAAMLRESLESRYYAATPVRQPYSYPLILGCVSVVAANLGAWQAAAQLQGAADADDRAGVIALPEAATFARAAKATRLGLGDEVCLEQRRLGQNLHPIELGRLIEHVLALAEQERMPPPLDSQDGLLTPREREVLRLLVSGKSNREIADALFISVRTAKSHVSSIFAKFDVETRAAAVSYAYRHDLA